MDDERILTANLLDERRDEITGRVLELDDARVPELTDRYGERGREFYRRDNNYHLLYLEQAVRTGSPISSSPISHGRNRCSPPTTSGPRT